MVLYVTWIWKFEQWILSIWYLLVQLHDDVIKWKHFPRYWTCVRGIHRSLVNFPHKGQWREALVFSLICSFINGSVNNREAGDLRRHRSHYDVIVMKYERIEAWTKRTTFWNAFFNGICCILIQISLKFVWKGPTDNDSALAKVTEQLYVYVIEQNKREQCRNYFTFGSSNYFYDLSIPNRNP